MELHIRGAEFGAFPFPHGKRYWFRLDNGTWASNGHFAIRLPWIDIGGESFDDTWKQVSGSHIPTRYSLVSTEIPARAVDRSEMPGEMGFALTPVLDYGFARLDERYVDAIRAVWPDANARFVGEKDAPVGFFSGDVMVGLVSPMWSLSLWTTPAWIAEAHRLVELCDVLERECRIIKEMAATMGLK